ncbi:sulfatase [Salmonella enterica]|uniref:Sulfatase-like hydrolase/transferase n=2 Tax=Salmonella enterica TaxID=28901 RepID=A0A639ZJZ2_SALER|nr:sulfatase [Salmonella enterica]EBW8393196.1 sulfatase [Salmonella enterica subsp. enterica serovar Florida]ECC9938133.1 sulfatase [Salmonella enterica subsp. enterica]ECX3454667.1 sulfatase-like hydrolase/transferase [Salmonella enterica subsp. enterica serovar Rubislaw]EDR3487699.1 sulfatase-like hydrolase/transferase [Salmonella enterica subsp. enterica serovar Midway]EAM6170309.1 sulfatase [Salmonella enterica]
MKAIILLFDSLNKNYLPPYGDLLTKAPNFQRLAEHAATFDNSYVGSMPCMPARRELHTGRYNFLHREWGPLEPFDDSMPELLKKAGIYTHLISDHLHYWEDGGGNYHNRYSSWDVVRGQEGDHWKASVGEPPIPEVLRVPQKQTGGGVSGLWRHDWANREYIQQEADFPQTKVFDAGCDFIHKNHAEDNWLLQVETFDPHEPFYTTEEYLSLYDDEWQGPHYDWPRGKVSESEEAIAHIRCRYRALVSMCDRNLGRILDLMDEHDLWRDTMLIVGTDHGFLLGEHGWWAKNQMPYYNEVANNPLFIWDPRSAVCGARRQSLVQMIDWAPTLLDYFQQPIPADMQGQPLAKVIASDEPVREGALFGVFSGHVNVTDGRYVYMRAAQPGREHDIANYTLMPIKMNARYDVDELGKLSLAPPFKFTKGLQVLRIPAREKYKGVNSFGHFLFDLRDDPQQQYPIHDEAIEARMINLLIRLMKENDAPAEQYRRLGLDVV